MPANTKTIALLLAAAIVPNALVPEVMAVHLASRYCRSLSRCAGGFGSSQRTTASLIANAKKWFPFGL